MNVTHTEFPWATRDWAVTGPAAAADIVAVEAVKKFDSAICVAVVAQAREVGKKLVATTYATNQEEADANAAFIVKAVNAHDKLVEALKEALATIDDYLSYEHNGDPWTEDRRTMGEMDIDDYEHDGRLERARAALAAAGEQV